LSTSDLILSRTTENMSTTLLSNGDVTHMTKLGLESNLSTSSADGIFFYQRRLQEAGKKAPILVLIHGYPET
jgi:hypothetical protein